MQPLKVNPETGYLESNQIAVSSLRTVFDSNKKVIFLKTAKEAIEAGFYPDIPSICDSLCIHQRTFFDHITKDSKFGSEWEDLRKRYESKLINELNEKAKSKMGVIANLALLKWLENRSWNDKGMLIHSTDSSSQNRVNNHFNDAIDADIIDNPQITSTQSSSNESK